MRIYGSTPVIADALEILKHLAGRENSMKKIISMFIAIAVLIGIIPIITADESIVIDGIWEYRLINDGTEIEIVKGHGNLNIPTVIDDKPVTRIGAEAFIDSGFRDAVIIPQGVTSIGERAFFGCTEVSAVVFPEGLVEIGDYAFSGCRITSLTFKSATPPIFGENGVFYYDYISAFGIPLPIYVPVYVPVGSADEYQATAQLSEAAGLLRFGVLGIFSEIPNAIPVEIVVGHTNEVVTADDVSAAVFAAGLLNHYSTPYSATFASGVTVIDDNAFGGHVGLVSVKIPAEVESIGESAFRLCVNLTDIDVHPENGYYRSENGSLFDKNQTVLIQYPLGNRARTYSIPDTVTNIDDYALEACRWLKEVMIPIGVTHIGESAFSRCTGLVAITFESGTPPVMARELTKFYDNEFYQVNVFDDCPMLNKIYVPKGSKGQYRSVIYENVDVFYADIIEIGGDVTTPLETTTTNPEIITPIPGDVDGNGSVTIADALEILKYLAGMTSVVSEVNPEAWNVARITGEDTPVIADALEILKLLARMSSVLNNAP